MKTKSYLYGVEKLNGYDAWALFETSSLGDLPRVKALLAKDPRLVNAQYWYQFPIHMAVFSGQTEIVKLLLAQGADPGQSRYTFDSWDKLLLYARERGHRQIHSLLQRAMKKRFNYHPDFEPLKKSIVARDSKIISALLRKNPRLAFAADALGNNALHWSVITRQLSLIDRLVQIGTPIDALRADGQTPVLLAANGAMDYWYRETRARSHPSLRNTSVMVGSLLAHGAHYSISVAAAVGDQERIEQLLKKDDTLARRLDSARRSPLSYAAQNGHLHLVRLLLRHRADPNLSEDSAPHGAALFNACCGNHLEIAQLLLDHGANPNAGTDSNGCCLTICELIHGAQARPLQNLLRRHGAFTPPYAMTTREMKNAIRTSHPILRHEEFLPCMMRKRDASLLRLYLDSDPTVPDRLWVGAYPTSSQLVRMLLTRGLDPNKTDWLGRTFLHFCATNGDLDIAKLFLNAGASINAVDLHAQTPLALAIRSCATEKNSQRKRHRRQFVELLQNHGALS